MTRKSWKVVRTDWTTPVGTTTAPERAILGELGVEFVEANYLDEDRLIEVCADADAIMSDLARITRKLIEHMPRCKIIAHYGVGVDRIDVEAATEHGIFVTNVPSFCTEEVADHAFALLLACARKVVELDRAVKQGCWKAGFSFEPFRPIHRLKGQVLGLVGFGRIARLVAKRARSIGLDVVSYDPYVPESVFVEHSTRRICCLNDLLTIADFVSLHLPLTKETEGLIGSGAISHMKKSAYLINTARGKLVDQDALYDALRKGKIAGAALDVLAQEPPDVPFPLMTLDNVILSPHAAWYSEEAIREVQEGAAQQVAMVIRGEVPSFLVNPQITKPRAGLWMPPPRHVVR